MEDISLCGLHLLKVMKKVDHEFHADNTRHSVKDAHLDIMTMATYILESTNSSNTTDETSSTTSVSVSFADPLIKGMQKIQSGWLRFFIIQGDLKVTIIDEIEPEDQNILTADEMNFELY